MGLSKKIFESDIDVLGILDAVELQINSTAITATATEINLLDLAGLTSGWVLSADSSTTASWKASPVGTLQQVLAQGNTVDAVDIILSHTGGGSDAIQLLNDTNAANITLSTAGAINVQGSNGLSEFIQIKEGYIGYRQNGSWETRLEFVENSGGSDNVITFQDGSGTVAFTSDIVGGGATELIELTDVSSATPTNKFALMGNGTTFVSRALVLADISDYPTAVEAYITDAPAIALLEGAGNWDIDGIYTGTAITLTFQGQKHYTTSYFYEAYDDNLWLRMPRG